MDTKKLNKLDDSKKFSILKKGNRDRKDQKSMETSIKIKKVWKQVRD